MIMQAEHIPVHLGSMPAAVEAVLPEHHAHLLAGGAQRAGEDLKLDRIQSAHGPPAPACRRQVPLASTVPDQPGGSSSVASGSA